MFKAAISNLAIEMHAYPETLLTLYVAAPPTGACGYIEWVSTKLLGFSGIPHPSLVKGIVSYSS